MKKIKCIPLVAIAVLIGCSKIDTPNTEYVCSYAPSQSKTVANLSSAAGGSAAAALAVTNAAGLTAVLHSSGAYIFTGASGYIAGTLGTALAAPALVTVGVVAGGSAITLELLCASKNHPAYVEQIMAAATEFVKRD